MDTVLSTDVHANAPDLCAFSCKTVMQCPDTLAGGRIPLPLAIPRGECVSAQTNVKTAL
jgi:hypothetical protein